MLILSEWDSDHQLLIASLVLMCTDNCHYINSYNESSSRTVFLKGGFERVKGPNVDEKST